MKEGEILILLSVFQAGGGGSTLGGRENPKEKVPSKDTNKNRIIVASILTHPIIDRANT